MFWINILILLLCLKVRKHLSSVLGGTFRMFPTHMYQLQMLNQDQLWTKRFPPYSYVKNQLSVWCCLEIRPLRETLRVRSVCSLSLFLPLSFHPLSVCPDPFLFPSFLSLCHAMWVYNMMTPAYKLKKQTLSRKLFCWPIGFRFPVVQNKCLVYSFSTYQFVIASQINKNRHVSLRLL